MKHETDEALPAAKRKKEYEEHELDLCVDMELIKNTSSEISTRSLIAKWWKKNQKRIIGKGKTASLILPESNNPHTLIHSISKHPMAEQFLRARCCHLHYCDSRNPSVLRSLSECYHILGDTNKALHFIEMACLYSQGRELGEGQEGEQGDCANQDELEWQRAIIQRQYDVQTRQAELLDQLPVGNNTTLPDPVQVERIHYDSLSYESFMSDYAMTGTPVIITGLELTQDKWTMEYLSKVIGDKIAPLRCPVPGSVEWARLESGGERRVRDFIHDIKTLQTHNHYLFDWSITMHCPELAKSLTIPSYFAGDILQATPTGTLYRDSWPSLFVSPGNITSSLHVDAFGSNFWMALFEGRKRWLFFPPEDLPCLYPSYAHSLDPVFQVDLDNPSSSYHLLSLTHPRECVLQPGEVLFVPAGSPHQVTSLDPSVAISANYIDKSNITRAIAELEVTSLSDSRAGELLSILKVKNGSIIEKNEAPPSGISLNWEEFKQK